MFTCIIFHWFIIWIIFWQLLNFKTCWLRTTDLGSLSPLISILVILIIYCAIWFLLTVNSIVLAYVDGVWIISIGLSLSWIYHSTTLNFSFLPGASPSTTNSSWISSTIIWLWVSLGWVKVLSSPRKSRQYILVVIFQWFVYFWNSLITSLRLKVMNYSLMSIACWSLTTYLILCLNGFFVLLDVRTEASSISIFFNFVFNCT